MGMLFVFLGLGAVAGLMAGFVLGWAGACAGSSAARSEWSQRFAQLQRQHAAELAKVRREVVEVSGR